VYKNSVEPFLESDHSVTTFFGVNEDYGTCHRTPVVIRQIWRVVEERGAFRRQSCLNPPDPAPPEDSAPEAPGKDEVLPSAQAYYCVRASFTGFAATQAVAVPDVDSPLSCCTATMIECSARLPRGKLSLPDTFLSETSAS